MVRNPTLLINYLRELGVNINGECAPLLRMGIKCPPDVNDDFRVRFFATSYLYLNALNMELRELGPSNTVSVDGLRELINDVLMDLRLYDAPQDLMNEVTRTVRGLIKLLR